MSFSSDDDGYKRRYFLGYGVSAANDATERPKSEEKQ
jgi:hypothetical protein